MTNGRAGDGSRVTQGYSHELFALPESVHGLLRDLVVERTGVLFDAGKRELLADKLSALVAENGLTSFLDYYYLLRYDDASESHLTALLNRLAVPETYFWRQSDQLEALAQVIAPAHFARKGARPLRVWCAACCSGEEAVSIAIAFAEAGLLDRHPIEIFATDGSRALVERAQRGEYGERAFRQLPAELRAKYFVSGGSTSRPIERLTTGIRWGVANLVRDEDIRPFASADVIFCRNVFIYFADDAVRRTVQTMADEMPADGCLFLGAAESLTRLGLDLELAEVGNAFGYVKPGSVHVTSRRRSPASNPKPVRRVGS
jgi:chemotaxis protein methyltransferase CheR